MREFVRNLEALAKLILTVGIIFVSIFFVVFTLIYIRFFEKDEI